MKNVALVILAVLVTVGFVKAEQAEPLTALSKMPIKEVTIFKDGHAFVLHSGRMKVNAAGKVVMDYLPAPVMGTYWPYSADEYAELRSVTAGKRKVRVEKTALSVREMIEANIGARVIIREHPSSPASPDRQEPYEATIVEIPTRAGEELEALYPSSSNERLPEKGNVVMLRTGKGLKTVEFTRIRDVTFVNERKQKVTVEEFRNLLTLDLTWKGKPRTNVDVGMVYLQRGIRWIPSYNITINSNGKAVLKLEATLINELTDMSDVTAHLVVGVPSFAFKDTVDPISLRQGVAQLTSSFRENNQTAYAFSNAIMSQQVAVIPGRRSNHRGGSTTMDLGPALGGSQKSEDLYIFTVNHLSLRKGERIVMPIAEYELSYGDVYALDIPFTAPPEVMHHLGHSQRRNLLRMHRSPKAKHKIRITNTSTHPLTTAPAMIMKDGRIVAQGMMTYTPVGGHVDIELTTAVDIAIKKTDRETKRTPNATRWNSDSFARIDLEGKITLTNYKKKPVTVEIVRHVLGQVDGANQQGNAEMINPFEDKSFLPDTQVTTWWYNYSWPWWWYRFNGIGRIKWTTTLEPGRSAEHTYKWHYLWN